MASFSMTLQFDSMEEHDKYAKTVVAHLDGAHDETIRALMDTIGRQNLKVAALEAKLGITSAIAETAGFVDGKAVNAGDVIITQHVPEMSDAVIQTGTRPDIPEYSTGPTEYVAGPALVKDGIITIAPSVGTAVVSGGEVTPINSEIDLRALFGAPPAPANNPLVPWPVPAPAPSTSLAPHVVAIPPQLDKDGLPWNQLIHSSTKALNNDGTWRVKRGVDKALVTKVTAELKQLMAIPQNGDTKTLPLPLTAAQAVPVLPQIPNVPTFPVVPPVIAAPPAAPSAAGSVPPPPVPTIAAPVVVPVPPQITAQSPVVAPVLPTKPSTVGELIVAITAKIAAGTLNQVMVNAACTKFGIPAIPLLGARPDLIPHVVAELGL